MVHRMTVHSPHLSVHIGGCGPAATACHEIAYAALQTLIVRPGSAAGVHACTRSQGCCGIVAATRTSETPPSGARRSPMSAGQAFETLRSASSPASARPSTPSPGCAARLRARPLAPGAEAPAGSSGAAPLLLPRAICYCTLCRLRTTTAPTSSLRRDCVTLSEV